MLKADFLLTWPNKKPKMLFAASLQSDDYKPLVKMFAALIHVTFYSLMLLFIGYVGYADHTKSYFSMHFTQTVLLSDFNPDLARSDTINITAHCF